jgi:hypothetical protein
VKYQRPGKCSLDCKGYHDIEFKLIRKGRYVVQIETCFHCFRVLSRTYFKKEKQK